MNLNILTEMFKKTFIYSHEPWENMEYFPNGKEIFEEADILLIIVLNLMYKMHVSKPD